LIYNELISDLKQAKKPVLLIGGGAHKYRNEFLDLTKVLRIPTLCTWNALDICTSDLPVAAGVVGTYGGPGRNFAIQSADLLLAVGTRISGRITGGTPERFSPSAKKYLVDIDEALLNPPWQPVKFDRNILMDAGEFMSGLTRELGGEKLDHEAWLTRTREWAEKYDPVRPEYLKEFHHYGFVRKLSERLPANAVLVSDTGGSVIMMGQCFKSKWGQRLFTSNGNTTMGFGFAGALGAWFAAPERPVICLIGDGGFNMNIQEIQTMLNYGCNVKTFILNNHCYGTTKLWQKSNNKALLACGPDGYSPPNFEAIARGYNVPVVDRIDCYCNLEEKIDELIKQPFPAIIDVVHHDFYDYYPRISRFDQELHDQDPPLPREEIAENMT
jgi:acetolactate synthase-1/2/3 large subunit